MPRTAVRPRPLKGASRLLAAAFAVFTVASCAHAPAPQAVAIPPRVIALQENCTAETAASVAAGLTGVSVATLRNGPNLVSGVRYVAATDTLPAFCQVSGAFVTNPATGKTASFLATFPANWNGKYLQYGCFGHCGALILNDASSRLVTIIAQGLPGDSIRKGYASFGTDEGHLGGGGGAWAATGDREADQDAIDDFLFRANKVLAQKGKDFTRAFYTRASGAPATISRAYFMGCSGGGRGAMIAAAYFPEMFDGIVAGSPYLDMAGIGVQAVAGALAPIRSPDADITPALIARIDPIVKAGCDKLDGVEDGLIQNPAACDFRPERDLPRCTAGAVSDQCFTQAQIETVSTLLTAVTDENGAVIQPGLSVSDFQYAFRVNKTPDNPAADEPWSNADDYASTGGLYPLGVANLKIFARQNDPAFHPRSLVSLRDGGPGSITAFRAVTPSAEAARTREGLRAGLVTDDLAPLIRQDRKLLMWHNLSDQLLTPYMSINYYKRLAARHGGYAKLQDNVRLFTLPDTSHCSAGGVGPGSFDALTAIETWVEQGVGPDSLLATLFPPKGPVPDFTAAPGRTLPLCKFPEMARYRGEGDVDDAVNWTCPAGDASMLRVGESGRRAGVSG